MTEMIRRTTRAGSAYILRVYKTMKSKPKKTFIVKDFTLGSYDMVRDAFNTLIKLGLVKEVPVIYNTGLKGQVCKTVKGYRLA